MSQLQTLIDNLNDSNRLIAALEADTHNDFAQFNILSIRKRRDEIASEIDEALALSQQSILQYRIERPESKVYPAKAVGEALERFQDLLTAVYDALTSGPKKRFRPSTESVEKTTLNFAGATAGSVKITMSAEDDRRLLGDTDFERALILVEKTLSAQTMDDLSALADEVGIASISKAYEWASTALTYGLETEVSWGKQLSSERNFAIRQEEAVHIHELIAAKSDDMVAHFDMMGILHGFDKQASYFHFAPMDGEDHIKGDVADSIQDRVMTGVAYAAVLSQITSTVFSTGEEKVRWTLEALAPLARQTISE